MNSVPKIDKGGRRKGIPKKTIGFKVPVAIADQVKEDVRPHVVESILRHQGGANLNDLPSGNTNTPLNNKTA